jgi:AraC family transcriptional regulator
MGSVRDSTTSGSSDVAVRWLFQSSTVSLHSWHCRRTNGGPGAEEAQTHHEVAFVLGGAFEIRGPRGHTLADPMTAVLLHAGEPYQIWHPLRKGDEGISLVVSAEILSDVNPGCAGTPPRRLAIPVAPRSHLLLSLLHRRLAAGTAADAMEVEEMLIDLLRQSWNDAGGGPGRAEAAFAQPADAHDRVVMAKRILAAGYDRPLLLAEIAAAVGVSVPHLCRLFRAETGFTLHRYLNRLRLRAALASMEAGRRDLSDVACSAGFSSHSHFTAAFRREFGLTPSFLREISARQIRQCTLRCPAD